MSTYLTLFCLLVASLLANFPPVSARNLRLGDQDDICTLPPYVGGNLCEGYAEAFYYNATVANCQMFVYGLCGGTANLFYTLNECQAACGRSEH